METIENIKGLQEESSPKDSHNYVQELRTQLAARESEHLEEKKFWQKGMKWDLAAAVLGSLTSAAGGVAFAYQTAENWNDRINERIYSAASEIGDPELLYQINERIHSTGSETKILYSEVFEQITTQDAGIAIQDATGLSALLYGGLALYAGIVAAWGTVSLRNRINELTERMSIDALVLDDLQAGKEARDHYIEQISSKE